MIKWIFFKIHQQGYKNDNVCVILLTNYRFSDNLGDYLINARLPGTLWVQPKLQFLFLSVNILGMNNNYAFILRFLPKEQSLHRLEVPLSKT
jgi:hypothetical protein